MNVEEIVRTTLQAEILKALKAAPEAIEEMVKAAIEKPVDRDTGNLTGYGTKIPYLEWVVGASIRSHLYKAVEEEMAGRHEDIRAAVKAHLSGDIIADGITKAVLRSASESWRIIVNFESDKER